jgi:glycosyltransferase involved in cell wall biosynthesis
MRCRDTQGIAANPLHYDISFHRLPTVSQPPALSVIIPCYNAERYIAATIASVLAQGHADLEIIVVDDGSKDGSVALVRNSFPAVRVIEQANQGVAAARNKGIDVAHGEWIAFVDADDIWLPGKLQAQFDAIAATPACSMSYTAWQVWPCDEPTPSAAYLAELDGTAGELARWAGPSGWIYPQLLLDCVVWTSTVLVKRTLLAETGAFDPTLRVGEDYDLWLRASRLTPIVRVARPFALYRMHSNSITRSLPTDNYRATVINRALAQWGLGSPDGTCGDSAAIRQTLAKSWSDFASAHLGAGNLGLARRSAWQALRADVAHLPAWKVMVKSIATGLSPARPNI